MVFAKLCENICGCPIEALSEDACNCEKCRKVDLKSFMKKIEEISKLATVKLVLEDEDEMLASALDSGISIVGKADRKFVGNSRFKCNENWYRAKAFETELGISCLRIIDINDLMKSSKICPQLWYYEKEDLLQDLVQYGWTPEDIGYIVGVTSDKVTQWIKSSNEMSFEQFLKLDAAAKAVS